MPKQEAPQEVSTYELNFNQELQRAQIFATGMKWELLNVEKFPFLAQEAPKLLLQFRLGAIAAEMKSLQDSISISTQSPEIIGVVRGAARILREATDATLLELYGNVTPEPMSHGPVEFTRDDAAWIELVKETGAVDLLHPDVIPSLTNLNHNQIRQMKLDALEIVHDKWERLSGFDFDSETAPDMGFVGTSGDNPLKEYAKLMVGQINAKILEISVDGLISNGQPVPGQSDYSI